MPDLSPIKAARRDKILNAAQHVFVTQGFRGVTMEGIAEAVGMSKVTVYGYFKDKDAVFAAVADRLASRLVEVVKTELRDGLTLRDKIGNALIAKHRVIFDLVRTSPHAAELFAAKDLTSQQRFRDSDHEIEGELEAQLVAGQVEAQEAAALARVLFAASQGIANHAERFEEIKDGIGRLTQIIGDEE
ncbi:TetR/AcrR family transcriptional regulator [Yoonia sp. R2-816]|uniref:TetR/AcrR family transcriptional regulator n=1 Tax=Yoonia sp. R2-816 TaxID=3342638 RepID=UPI0037294F09